MFRLVRLFLVTSAIAFATVSAAVVFYRQSEVEHLIAFAESQNVALAQAFEIDFVIGRGAVAPRVPHGLSPTLQCMCFASSSEAIFPDFPAVLHIAARRDASPPRCYGASRSRRQRPVRPSVKHRRSWRRSSRPCQNSICTGASR